MILKQGNCLYFILHVLSLAVPPLSTTSSHPLDCSYSVERVVIIALLRRISAIERRAIILVQLQPFTKTLRQIRVRDEVAAEDDAVSLAGLDLDGGIVAVEVSCGEECDACGTEDVAEDVEGVLLLLG